MRSTFLIILAISMGVLVLLVDRAKRRAADPAELAAGWLREPEEHKVTAEMLAGTEALVATEARGFAMLASDGKTYDFDQLVVEKPIVLLFIKEDCPCSVEAQPYFNSLAALHGDRVGFLGVIDGGEAVAREWARRRKATFPLLCDPELRTVKDYRATNSVYVALVSKGGTLEAYWPGFSAPMLEDLNRRLAAATGVEPRPIDTTDAPAEMVSGCPYPE
jgi:peroxiredoxin